jgi:TolA-binding protein
MQIAAPAQYFIGICYQQLQNLPALTKAFQKVVSDFGDYSFPGEERLQIGLYLQKQRQYELAIQAYRQVLLHSKHRVMRTEAQYWIGECYQLQKQYKQAIVEYLKVTYLHSEEDMWAITARFKAGEAYQNLGQWEEAIKLYQVIAKNHADSTQGRFAAKRIKQLEELLKEKGQNNAS